MSREIKREEYVGELSESVKKAYKLLFKKLDEYESETNKIFEENFDENTFIDFTKKKLIGKSANSVLVKVSLLKKYAEHLGIYSVVKLKRDEIIKMTEESLKQEDTDEYELRYVNWNDFKRAIGRLENPIDVAIVYLLRMGVNGGRFKELINLKSSDIDLKKKTIKFENRTIEIDDEVCDILKEAIEQDKYTVMLHSESSTPYASEFEFNMACPYLIKQKPKKNNNYGLNPYTFSGITNRIFRITNEMDIGATAMNLLQSYAVDRLIEHEKEIGKKLSTSEAFDFFKSIGCKGSFDAVRLRIYLDSRN